MFNKEEVNYSLYLITDRKGLGDKELQDSVEAAVKGGVTLVQLREKNLTGNEYYQTAVSLKRLLRKYNVPLIINDRVDIALAACADGVHLGPEDLPIPIARKILGPDMIIGASANCVEEAVKFRKQGADYLGIGALFPTKTKNNTESVSMEQLKHIRKAVDIPMVGIGGINAVNASLAKAAGIDGVAVASAILGEEDVFKAAWVLADIIKQ